MNEVSVTRTPEMVAAEINLIKDQTRKLVLSNSILIGKKLQEVKEMLEPGQFGKWLSEAVDFSQSTANNLMRVYDEYGADQGVLFGSAAKSEVVEKLTYTQAVLLLGVPTEQRDEFIEAEHVEDLSTRELKAKIKELKEAKESAEQEAKKKAKLAQEATEKLAAVNDEVAKSNKEARILLDSQSEIITELQDKALENKKIAEALNSQRDALETEAKELRKSLADKEQESTALEERIKDLEEQLKQPVTVATKTEVIEKVPEAVAQELEQLRAKLAEAQLGAAEQKEALELKVEIMAVLSGINKLISSLDKVSDSKRGAGVCKALQSALAQSQAQITKRLEKFEQEGK